MKGVLKANDANFNIANRLKNDMRVSVTPIRDCGNCGKPAVVLIAGLYPRCQPCANHLVNLWNTIKEGD